MTGQVSLVLLETRQMEPKIGQKMLLSSSFFSTLLLECIIARSINEVQQDWAPIVHGRETAWELELLMAWVRMPVLL